MQYNIFIWLCQWNKFLGPILMTFYVGLNSILMVLLEYRIYVVIPFVISYFFKYQIKWQTFIFINCMSFRNFLLISDWVGFSYFIRQTKWNHDERTSRPEISWSFRYRNIDQDLYNQLLHLKKILFWFQSVYIKMCYWLTYFIN